MAPTLVGTPVRTGFSATRSPGTGNVAAAGVLQENDVVAVFGRAGLSTATFVTPANWTNGLNPGTNDGVASAGTVEIFLWHAITAAEDTADTRAWTFSNMWNSSQTGALYCIVVRGADPTDPVDAINTLTGNGSTHGLAGLEGDDIARNDDLVASGIGGDGSSVYNTAPAGWTFAVKNAAGQNQGAVLTKDVSPTPGTDFGTTNITSSGSANYSNITAAFKAPGGAAVSGNADVALPFTIEAAGTVTKVGNASVTLDLSVAPSGVRTVVGNVSISLPVSISDEGSRTTFGSMTLELPIETFSAGDSTGNIGGDLNLTLPIEINADGTVRRFGSATVSLDLSVNPEGRTQQTIHGDVTVELPIALIQEGESYKLVPTGWYCFPEEQIPGPPYEIPNIPGM